MSLIARFGAIEDSEKYVQVACLISDSPGDWVYIRGDKTAEGRLRVEKADPEDQDKMPVAGLLLSKHTPTTGIMQRADIVEEGFSGFTPGKFLWLGPSGLLEVPPTAPPGGRIVAQQVAKALASDVLEVLNGTGMVCLRNNL